MRVDDGKIIWQQILNIGPVCQLLDLTDVSNRYKQLNAFCKPKHLFGHFKLSFVQYGQTFFFTLLLIQMKNFKDFKFVQSSSYFGFVSLHTVYQICDHIQCNIIFLFVAQVLYLSPKNIINRFMTILFIAFAHLDRCEILAITHVLG